MKVFIFLFSFLLTLETSASFIGNLNAFEAANDDLGLRVYLRKEFKKKKTISEWFEARKILTRRPKIGFDVVAAWDRQISLKESSLEKDANSLAIFLDKADEYSFLKQFDKSFEMYQRAARFIKKNNKNKVPKGNQLIYLNVLHQMARSLYAQKRFAESLEVYDWIPASYPQIRQVLFEKMWAAFRADKYDFALGAIASQQSGYFSEYLNPESYLIKIYIFKKLCRKKDLNYTLRSIKEFLTHLKNGKLTYLDWAKSDLYYMSLAQLVEASSKINESIRYDLISKRERQEELKRVHTALKQKFQIFRPMLQMQLERVLGYAALASAQDQDFLKPVKSLPEASVLESRGYELWPVNDGEEWLDEIGTHVFIGDSECVPTKEP
ncbi:MAG: hypothetical protein AABY64_07980 [Bdellovibrionota bacterium]